MNYIVGGFALLGIVAIIGMIRSRSAPELPPDESDDERLDEQLRRTV